MNTYLIPGLGGDRRMYAGQLKRFKDTKVLEFIEPLPHETISAYSKRLAEGIDKTKPFQLVGVSLGGILCQEIASQFKPDKVIIISSVKSRKELPVWIRFFKNLPLQKVIPGKFYLWAFMVLVSLRSIFKRSDAVIGNLKAMAKDANPIFVKWAVNEVINWNEPIKDFNPIHIHGNKDVLFPLSRLSKVHYTINKGTHAMVLTHVNQINEALEKELLGLT